ncbi:MAG: flagellar hook capping FlgD N-terminal domain-containing protein [Bdellovibrionales bacterium]|jgi:flagellar basal-body rod modification protein FlgD|nr:flagellar hook capping FlgD N-terminal domain-containing protein [Bdellovibrionales bacterium]
MNVNGTTSTTNTASSTAQTQLNTDFDQFLRLLTTQLQNQDPLSPMDTNEFTNQLVQFSQVEQQIKTNGNLENLLAMQTLNMTALGVSFIGKFVEVDGDTFSAEGGQNSTLSYFLPAAASSGTLTIKDADGKVVHSADIEKTAGRHELSWDGMDKDGNPVAAGKYTVTVTALDSENKSLSVQTSVPGYVTGLESADSGELMMVIDGQKVPLTGVRKIALSANA